MIVLALDTCLGACSVAVLDGDSVLARASELMMRGHQERLGPMTFDVMKEAGMGFESLDRIGVTVGPGSFTGLRVGLAFAKGLALALDRPCVGIGSLEALSAGIVPIGASAAVIDAGRGNVYLQRFDGGGAVGGPDVLPVDLASARLAEATGLGEVTLVGPSAALLAAIAPKARAVVLAAPAPETVARLAARAPPVPPMPLYLRPPDAKPKIP